ncbi:MAG: dihydrodipicolinate synthase family protein, partial [Opitutaceae bacterium]|nr:dihydrodipicolinate synthase family protein [Opitutaceae bacterium]
MSILEKNSIRAALRGHVIVPMISPLAPSGGLDLPATFRVADHSLGGGCQGLLVGGTNGEGPSLATALRIAQIEAVAARAAGRGMVYAGVGATAFDDAVEIGRAGLRAGAVAVVAHPPPCFIINAAEIEAYYLKLIDAIGGPFFIYNMPLTTGVSIPLDVVGRLGAHPLVMGIKDSEGDAERQERLAAAHRGRADFTVFCGAMAHSA